MTHTETPPPGEILPEHTDKLDRSVLVVAGVVVLGAIMSILDITVVSVALQTFQHEFEATAALDPDDYQCLSLAIMAYDHLGEPERAEETARRALARVAATPGRLMRPGQPRARAGWQRRSRRP